MVAMGDDDARAAMEVFRGRTRRIVVLSSGDVYRAYGRFTRLEPGPPDPVPLNETSPLRTALYPHRTDAKSPNDWVYRYERSSSSAPFSPNRTSKASCCGCRRYTGQAGTRTLRPSTSYGISRSGDGRTATWRTSPRRSSSPRCTTRRRAELQRRRGIHAFRRRARRRSARPGIDGASIAQDGADANFAQDIVYDTARIRRELGYVEPIPYAEGLERTLASRR